MLIRSCRRIIVKTRDSSDEIFNLEDCDTIAENISIFGMQEKNMHRGER